MRPEEIKVTSRGLSTEDAFQFPATIERITYAGSDAFYRMRGPGGLALSAVVHRPDGAALGATGKEVEVALPLAKLHAFDAESGERIELDRP